MLRILIVLAILSTACERLENQYDAIEMACGIDPASLGENESLIKILGPDGEDIENGNVLGIKSRRLASDGSSSDLSVTAKGCVRLPSRSGVLQVLDQQKGWGLTRNFDNAPSRFQSLQLQSPAKVEAELQCPSQGLFASDRVAFPLRWNSDGGLASTRIELLAESDAGIRSVFRKEYGQNLEKLPSDLSTIDLPEGSYRLRAIFQDSFHAWDQPMTLTVESCPLTVLHAKPVVGGVSSLSLKEPMAVYSEGQSLNWKSQSVRDQLFVCREKRGEGESCGMQGVCADATKFEAVSEVLAEKAGLFDYYVYAEDKAGNRSATSCQSLLIRSEKPELNLRWAEAKWQRPMPIMEKPLSEVVLQIRSSVPELDNKTVWKSVQCKTDFQRADQSIAELGSGKYDNCSADTRIALNEFWPRIGNQGGALRMHVKAEDRAGSIQEKTLSLDIQPQRWKPTLLSGSSTLEDTTFFLLQDAAGRIYKSRNERIQRFKDDEESWEDLPMPEHAGSSFGLVDMWTSGDGNLYAQWPSLPSIMRWDLDHWTSLPTLSSRCEKAEAYRKNGFWCRTQSGIAYWNGSSWIEHAFSAMSNQMSFVQSKDSQVWILAGSSLFHKKMGEENWTEDKDVLGMGIDARDEVWVVRGRYLDELSFKNETAQSNIPRPAIFPWYDLRTRDFLISPSGEVLFGPNIWKPETQTWELLPYFKNYAFDQHIVPAIALNGETFYEYGEGFLIWDGKDLENWDLRNLALQATGSAMRLAFDAKHTPVLLAKDKEGGYDFPYKVRNSPWILLAGPDANNPMSQLYMDAKGQMSSYVPGQGLFQREGGAWRRIVKSPAVQEFASIDTTVFEPLLLSPQAVFLMDDNGAWQSIARFDEESYYYGGVADRRGVIWLYNGNKAELAYKEGRRFATLPLGEELGTYIKSIQRLGDELLVFTDLGLFRLDEGKPAAFQSWTSLGFNGVDRIREVDQENILVTVQDEESGYIRATIFNPLTEAKKAFAIPNSGLSLGFFVRSSKGDYIYSLGFNLYRGDGETWTLLMNKEQLYSIVSKPGIFLSYQGLKLDPQDRIWVHAGTQLLLREAN